MKNIPLHGSLKIKYKGKILKIAFKEDIKLEGDMGRKWRRRTEAESDKHSLCIGPSDGAGL